jgi:predicted RNA-binding protein with PUA-like domain
MRYWLLKTEPSSYSFADLKRDERTTWDGVKNPMALKHLGQMRKDDRVFIYHTGGEKAVVGMALVTGAPRPDPKKNDARLLVVDLAVGQALPRPVTLGELRADPTFAGWDLLRLPRLSVMPVSPAHWNAVLRLARQ